MIEEDKQPIWSPSEERINNSNLTAFIKYVSQNEKKYFGSYNDFYEWSVTEIEKFWEYLLKYSGIKFSLQYKKVLSDHSMPGAKWFEGSKLNFAENLLRFRDDKIAIISSREHFPEVKLTYSDLYERVNSVANYLKQLGVKEGDRVAGLVTNIPEAIIAMLATTSLGALWSSCSPDFGTQGIIDRFGQIEPKILFAIESYYYNGKHIKCNDKIEAITRTIGSIKTTVLISEFDELKIGGNESQKLPDDKVLKLSDLLKSTSDKIEFVQLPFDHPVYIMYSSGTTGIPKCIVHGAGGTLLQHYKELPLHTNLKREDVITYYTTCGWMMWNWLVSSLYVGATIFLYDGSPVFPDENVLWEKIDEHNISIFGTSPKFLTLCQKAETRVSHLYNLKSLHTILSTGSPLSDENFKWVYENVKGDLQLSSISGGTDIISCFMLGNPNLPVYSGELQCRGLGMAVKAFDEKGESVIEQKGELVCVNPFPSMPVYFWNDADNEKYISAYFNSYPGIWRHGDLVKITENGGIIIYGRSDATLNPGGVRIGTAEIYRVVESMDEISDSIVVGQKWQNDVRVILFIVMKEGFIFSTDFIDKVKLKIRNATTPRHVPSKIIQIKQVPHTINGKKVELAVTKILNGEEIDNKEALANPEALEQFYNIPALK
ncbi:MAG: acetoacetate--CoA ligase [Ignavibacteriales bacterium]|nr:MAG: acetoacetate--CoA ligase [Ignavibacteriales bacterium]